MRTRWIVWGTVTALFAAFSLAGWVAATSVTKPITLARGSTVDVTLMRLVAGPLRAELSFADNNTRRPELGDSGVSGDWKQTGVLRFPHPGAPVRMTASFAGSDPILFEAMPGGRGSGYVIKNLTTNLSIEPGVWRWPPPADPRSRLAAGHTTVRFEVVAVDDRLNGESVELTVLPQLGVKSCQAEVCWLGGWILWPVFAVLQAGWAAILVLISLRSRTREHRSSTRAMAASIRVPAGDDDV